MNDEKSLLVLSGGTWHGDVMHCDFMVPRLGLSGIVACDWRGDGPRYTLHQGGIRSSEQARAVEQLTNLLRPFFRGTFVGLTDDQVAALYPGGYHLDSGYCDEDTSMIPKTILARIEAARSAETVGTDGVRGHGRAR